jgi:hypothetical protein
MHGLVVVVVVDDVVVVVAGTISVNAVVDERIPAAPTTVMTLVLAGAPFATAILSTELTLPPAGGVTGLRLKLADTPDGNVGADKTTAELNPPTD